MNAGAAPAAPAPRWATWALVAGLVVVCAVRAAVGEVRELRFNADAEAYLMQVHAWAHRGIPPEHGILTPALGVDLGVLYLAALVPVSWLTPSPVAVHAVNVALFAVGAALFVLGLRRRIGVPGAAVAAALFAMSEHHAVLVEVAYHIGAVPGAALAWLGCAAAWSDTGQRRWLVGGAVALATVAQLHPLGAVYGVGALWLLVARRRALVRADVLWALAAFGITTVPMWLYLVPSAGSAGQAALHGTAGGGVRLGEALLGLVEMTGARWGVSPWSAGVVLGGAALAVRQWRDPLVQALAVTAVVGLGLVAAALGFESSGRYFLAAVPAVFALAAVGAGPYAGRWRPFGLLGALGLAALAVPPPSTPTAPSHRDTLVVPEQVAVMQALADRGLRWGDVASRVHGPLLGAEGGPRYLSMVLAAGPSTADPGTHWVVRPADEPPPPRVVSREVLAPAGRDIALYAVRPAFAPNALRAAGAPCPHVLPFLWVPLDAAFLRRLGFPGHGADVHRCLARGQGLSVPVRPGDTLTVELADDATFRGEAVGARFTWAPGAASTPGAVADGLSASGEFAGAREREGDRGETACRSCLQHEFAQGREAGGEPGRGACCPGPQHPFEAHSGPVAADAQARSDRTRYQVTAPPGARWLTVRPDATRLVYFDIY